MRLNTRIATLERQTSGIPALMNQWVDMLTRLSTSLPINADRIGVEARYYAGRGIPATISDWLHELRAIADESEARE